MNSVLKTLLGSLFAIPLYLCYLGSRNDIHLKQHLLNALMRWYSGRVLKRIRLRILKGEEVNDAALVKILTANKDTIWGRRYNFAQVLSTPNVAKAYQTALPLVEWSDIDEPLTAMMYGAPKVLCKAPVKFWYTTPGTTGRFKFIPVCGAPPSSDWKMASVICAHKNLPAKQTTTPLKELCTFNTPPADTVTPSGVPYGLLSVRNVGLSVRKFGFFFTSPSAGICPHPLLVEQSFSQSRL
eukprot:NODE_667_length_1960_cov_43.609384_g618_i0.p2 GENE.NODE_667_length_1960_cov_43.609384_g618_i0~~NODE_667_length_1960_cov_43.609384_g618_i0.p2  ORF type:complete len:253 (+),score=69.50 NODE_667_length_1960_cov_43.609384_g618_i0:41-760(+)